MLSLETLRKAAGKTQMSLAAEIGVHEKTVRLWENHGVMTSLDKAVAIAEALDCSLDQVAQAFGLMVPSKNCLESQ